MAKFILVGFWTCLVSLGALILGVQGAKYNETIIEEEHSVGYKRTNVITVPVMVSGNKVKGYIASQLIYLIDEENAKSLRSLPLDLFINDEIFRIFFGAYSDTHDIRQVKFDEIKPLIIDNINHRFSKQIIKELLVERFEFISSESIVSSRSRKNRNL